MQGSSLAVPEAPSQSGESSDSGVSRRLTREFSAPIGLLDPTTLIWRAREGLDHEHFPDADAAMTAALSSGVLWHGRVSTWRPGREIGPIWALSARSAIRWDESARPGWICLGPSKHGDGFGALLP